VSFFYELVLPEIFVQFIVFFRLLNVLNSETKSMDDLNELDLEVNLLLLYFILI